MFKLWAAIVKDAKILIRDKVGLTFMFAMPVLLVVVITILQSSTFELVNENKVPLLICNKDTGIASQQLVQALDKVGMFNLYTTGKNLNGKQVADSMHKQNALIALVIPANFSVKIALKAKDVSDNALNDFGVKEKETIQTTDSLYSIQFYYHPVLQASYRQSIQGALHSALQLVESKQVLQTLYFSLNEKKLPESLENKIINNQIAIQEIPVSKDGNKTIPNATQHNIPAWTIFAMFFIVTSLGSNLVKEKLSGSFIRLKTLPTNYIIALFSKQITYMVVCLAQVLVIFSIGVWLFPVIGLPALNIPNDFFALIIVSVVCAWCAISYAQCIGVFAQTQEQANGFGAISIIILAAIGGILVPSFAMPHSFQALLKISPMYWCLESYYSLFLERGGLPDVLKNLIPLLVIAIILQIIALLGLKKKNLI
ncbi:MAG TPA: ABC transporter permease [Bacteroidia bacterium]|nr:ABC transporter permease [Bacteroidia bacterium]